MENVFGRRAPSGDVGNFHQFVRDTLAPFKFIFGSYSPLTSKALLVHWGPNDQ